MENNNIALKEALISFLKDFNRAWYSIEEPVALITKHFDLKADNEWWVWITLHTSAWDESMNATKDIDLADLQSTVNWLKNRARIYLHNEFWVDA